MDKLMSTKQPKLVLSDGYLLGRVTFRLSYPGNADAGLMFSRYAKRLRSLFADSVFYDVNLSIEVNLDNDIDCITMYMHFAGVDRYGKSIFFESTNSSDAKPNFEIRTNANRAFMDLCMDVVSFMGQID